MKSIWLWWDRLARGLTDKFYYILIYCFIANMVLVFFVSAGGLETWVITFLFEIIYVTLTLAARYRYKQEVKKLFRDSNKL